MCRLAHTSAAVCTCLVQSVSTHTHTHTINKHTGADRLTAREAELCASARLLPVHYLSLKDVMMRDAQVHGHISRHDVSVYSV